MVVPFTPFAPFEKFDLTGKTALITGGATGLGFQMARALARSGARVILAARRKDVLEKAATELMQDPLVDDVKFYSVDLFDRDDVAVLANKVIVDHGGIDIFIGNAATNFLEQISDIKTKSIDDMFQLNLTANMQLVQAFLPGMRERRWGRVIFSSSVGSHGVVPLQGSSVYAATKAALNSFARTVAADMGHHNITANAVVLGVFMTDMLERGQRERAKQGPGVAEKFLADLASVTALGRLGNPAEVEGLVQLLASDAGSYITGASLIIDGGMSIMMRPLAVE